MNSHYRNEATRAAAWKAFNPPHDHKINGVAMTYRQHQTARAFARAGYRVCGMSYGCVVIRDHHNDEVHLNGHGHVVPDYFR